MMDFPVVFILTVSATEKSGTVHFVPTSSSLGTLASFMTDAHACPFFTFYFHLFTFSPHKLFCTLLANWMWAFPLSSSFWFIKKKILSHLCLIHSDYILQPSNSNQFHGAESLLRSQQLLSHSRNFQHFMKSKGQKRVHKRLTSVSTLS